MSVALIRLLRDECNPKRRITPAIREKVIRYLEIAITRIKSMQNDELVAKLELCKDLFLNSRSRMRRDDYELFRAILCEASDFQKRWKNEHYAYLSAESLASHPERENMSYEEFHATALLSDFGHVSLGT